MDFDFTSEQVMLRDLAREMLAQESSPAAVRQIMEAPEGYSSTTWLQLAEMGLQGITTGEAHGGQGLGMVDLAVVLEEMGRAAYPGPYFSTVLLAGSAIQAGGEPDQQATYLPGIASGETKATLAVLEDPPFWVPGGVGLRARSQQGGFVLSGVKRFVPFAHLANLILVAARTRETSDPSRGITLFALPSDAAGLSISPNLGFDKTSRTATLTLENVRIGGEAVIGRVDEGWEIVETVLRRAAVGAAAEMLGAARRCMDMSVEYAKVREQFGQPIGSFQAIKHACAEMLMEVENSHAAVYYAAWALDAHAPDAALAASIAKSYVGDASRKVCGASIQVHGGIGFTWDYDLHLYFKRAKHLEAHYGDAELHRELALQAVLASVPVPVLA